MMRALFAGVAGLKTHQTRMDVIGNNIANVNTTAYKSQSMVFSDLMYQTTQAASGANAQTGVGGINARQIGLGSKTGAIKTAITTQGASQSTNDPFDIMITGDAFFIVNNGSENFFTRDGSFYIDGAGNLAMTSTGYNVMGWQTDPTDDSGLSIKQDTVSPLKIMTPENMEYEPAATTLARITGIVDRNDTNVNSDDGKIMNLDFYDDQGYKYTARFSLHAIDGDAGTFYVKLDDVIDINGDSIVPEGVNIEDVIQFNGGAEVEIKPEDTTTTPPTPAVKIKNAAILQFDSTKKGAFSYVGAAGTKEITLSFGGSTTTTPPVSFPAFQNINIDFSGTQNVNNNNASTITPLRGDESGNGAGRKVGKMSGVSIQKDGKIFTIYDNGMRKLVGQIAVATFANASGLAKEGDNLYSATQNSGDFDGIGQDITAGGTGYMNTGVLEMSNVDLAAEFTEMITTQRGFQANSRIITVSDTLLEELTNLKR